jgi:pyruvate/2-oxoglutarate dehydrogenase complex dihydrolipoamide dehydrogenase (E3) component
VDGPNDLKNDDFQVLNPKIFVTGDCADAFGALNAGHTAYYQGEMAAENVLELIKAEEKGKQVVELQEYTPPTYGIKVSLGRVSLGEAVPFLSDRIDKLTNVLSRLTSRALALQDFGVSQYKGKLGTVAAQDCRDNLHTEVMWTCREMSDDNMYL